MRRSSSCRRDEEEEEVAGGAASASSSSKREREEEGLGMGLAEARGVGGGLARRGGFRRTVVGVAAPVAVAGGRIDPSIPAPNLSCELNDSILSLVWSGAVSGD